MNPCTPELTSRELLGSVGKDGLIFTPWATFRDPRPRKALAQGFKIRRSLPKYPGQPRKTWLKT